MSSRGAKRPRPHPFLKWAGGKYTKLPALLERLPEGPIDLYVEPFLGGGALFLELARQGRIRRAILNDRNPELV
ncbi:MAG: DNA adenine methylase, partial [Myxococcales bacterium]|nr:DNA adenine methylase [Myxococcales bacterium]